MKDDSSHSMDGKLGKVVQFFGEKVFNQPEATGLLAVGTLAIFLASSAENVVFTLLRIFSEDGTTSDFGTDITLVTFFLLVMVCLVFAIKRRPLGNFLQKHFLSGSLVLVVGTVSLIVLRTYVSNVLLLWFLQNLFPILFLFLLFNSLVNIRSVNNAMHTLASCVPSLVTFLRNDSKKHFRWELAIVFGVSLVLALLATRGLPSMSKASWGYLGQALQILDGNGLGGNFQRPPGYPLLIAFFSLIGFKTYIAGWAVSLLAFSGTSTLTYAFAKKISGTLPGFFGVWLLITFPAVLTFSHVVNMGDMLLTFFAILSFYSAFTVFSLPKGQSPGRIQSVLLGIGIVLPFWIKYIGVINVFFAALLLASAFYRDSEKRSSILLVGTTIALLGFVLPLRNLLFAGTMLGHSLEGQPGDTFLSAFAALVNTTNSALNLSLGHWGSAFLYLLLLFISRRTFVSFILTLFPLAYFLMFSFSASSTRLDEVCNRFVLPVLPFLIISFTFALKTLPERLVILFNNVVDEHTVQNFLDWLIFLCAVAFFILGVHNVTKGVPRLDGTVSEETIAWVRKNIPKNETVAVNLYGSQILAFPDTPEILILPSENSYNSAYGIHAYDRKTALEIFIRRNVTHLVFCFSTQGKDLQLELGYYGSYFSELCDEKDFPEVDSRIKRADSLIIKLVNTEKLRKTLENLDFRTIP